jgi:uncharacterized protein YecE (DUF72 family)
VDWYIGSITFAEKSWLGPFYPRGTKSADYLAVYARHFNAVELDTTFYAVPGVPQVRKWADAVPDPFRFCVKTPRGITHDSTLVGSVRPMLTFLDVMRNFGDKLGAVLLQFPPSFAATEFGKLEQFLAQLPTDVRYAVEFRNSTWRNGRTAQLLRSNHIAWVAQDYAGQPADLTVTTDFLYLRFIGQHDRFQTYDREQVDPTNALKWWKTKADTTTAQRAFAVVSNDYAGFAVGTAQRLMRLAGLSTTPLPSPPARDDQPSLFG